MEFQDWKPYYDRVLDDMDYDRGEDRRAAALAAELTDGDGRRHLDDVLRDTAVVVAGAGPSLEDEVADVGDAAVVAADSALPRLLTLDVEVDVVCTDLDGAPEEAASLSHDATAVVVHAHGDNRDLLRRWLPEMNPGYVVATCQCRPPEGVHNYGGFTDGDRAAYVADEFDAASIELAGFDFTAAEGEKKRKLDWARRLLEVLEGRRGEALLD